MQGKVQIYLKWALSNYHLIFLTSVEAKWVEIPGDVAVDVNSSHSWNCKAIGVPPITYKWFHNGRELKRSDRYLINNSSIKIPQVKLNDSGMYQCCASNEFKKLMTSAELQVKGESRILLRTVNFLIYSIMCIFIKFVNYV